MKFRTKLLMAIISLVGTGAGLAIWLGSSRWNGKICQLVEKLRASVSTSEAKMVSFKDFDVLPRSVAKYFRFALKDGHPLIRMAKIKHIGEFNLNDKWIPFESEQHFSLDPPAFVWNANMQMNSLLNVRVRDIYFDGKGSMHGEILALFPVVDAHDNEKLNEGALQRYLAESAWQPTALLPSENLKWSAIDDNRALATLTDGGVKVSLEFSFNEKGEIIGIFSPARFKETNGKYKPFPWAGRFWNYEEKNGMMIPLQGEVEWQMPEGNMPYWKGRVVEAEYDFAH